MGVFQDWLKKHRRELAERVVGTAVVDENQLSDAELLAKARAFFPQPTT